MTRARHFLKGLGSGYLLLIGNTVSIFVSLPLALHFLERSEYTVWLVVSQVAGYLSMIDVGTSSAGIRLLVDHKDNAEKGDYGSLLKSMCLIQVIQAGVILVVGIGIADLLPELLKNVPPDLVGDFRALWIWQVIFLSVNFVFRIGNQVLQAHQRLDFSNYSQFGALLLNLVVLLGAFRLGLGLYSFVIAQGVSSVLMLAAMLASCAWLKLLPRPGAWGSVSRVHLKRLLGLGSEFFLVTLGSTVIVGSQGFLLTRLLSWDAALVWSVMTKVFTLSTQIVWRIIGAATPAFAEMFVRGEMDRLWKRYRSVLEVSVLASGYFGLLIGFGNNAFVEIWTRKPISWEPINNWMLAAWFLLLTQTFCHVSLILYLKEVRWLKVVYAVEGLAFILLSIFVIPRAGIPGMLLCSLVCTAFLTASYSTHRVSKSIGKPIRAIAFEWLVPVMRFLAIMLPLGMVLAYLTRESSWLRILGCVVPLGIIGVFVAMRFCVPRDLFSEILIYLPHPLRRIAGALAGSGSPTR